MRLALLISGGGTTAAAIITAARSGKLKNITPAAVIASSPDSAGIGRVIAAGLPKAQIIVLQPKTFKKSADFGGAILQTCEKFEVDLIGQYGWLCKTPANVIARYQNMMINQHPGPLDPGRPDFGGKGMFGRRVHAARLLFVNKVKRDYWSEATSQRVAVEFDKGAVLKRKQVPILPDDTVESLAARMLPVEHEVQIETLQDFANGKIQELIRNIPLVMPGEEQILDECKRQAELMYPKG